MKETPAADHLPQASASELGDGQRIENEPWPCGLSLWAQQETKLHLVQQAL